MHNDKLLKQSTAQEIIINTCFGGFRLSDYALKWLHKNKGWKITDYNDNGHGYKDETAKIVRSKGKNTITPEYYSIPNDNELRVDPDVIQCVKTLGEKANSIYSKLKIIEIPKGVQWEIDEYDGIESVHEVHRSWN